MNACQLKLFIAAVSAVLLISPALAGPEPGRLSSAPVSGVKAAAEPTALSTAPAGQADDVISRLENWDKVLTSLRCAFTQNVQFRDAGLEQKVEGTIFYMKPDHLRIEHTLPSRQVVVTDRKTLWIYKPEDSQVIKADWGEWENQQNKTFSGIMDFGSYSDMLAKHEVKIDTAPAGGGFVKITLAPRDNPGSYTLEILLSEDYFPKAATLEVGKTVITTTLDKIEKNQKIPEELFNFTPPKGANVINFSPEK